MNEHRQRSEWARNYLKRYSPEAGHTKTGNKAIDLARKKTNPEFLKLVKPFPRKETK